MSTTTTLHATKLRIWELVRRCPINLQVAADRARVRLPITQVHEAEKLLKALTKKQKPKREVSKEVISRYESLHKSWFAKEYPEAFKDGHYTPPIFPDIGTTNGLTKYVSDFIKFSGGYANRLNVAGRQIGGITTTASGAKFDDRKFITSSTRKGTEDLDCVWQGRKIAIEIKNAVTKDKLRPDQVKQKARIEKAGGMYWVVTSVEDFLGKWDAMCKQGSIFDTVNIPH